MKTGFYEKLAADGIKKNIRLYLPYMITGCMMITMFYILSFLSESSVVAGTRGGSGIQMILPFGSFVVGSFSLIFLFYTNSFLIRQRYREFGLYNILGIDKRKIGRIVLWESFFTAAITISIGIILGILFSKFAELALLNMIDSEILYDFSINKAAIIKTVVIFVVIYFILFLNALIKIHRSNPLELMKSSQVGEKPPKGNWLFAIIGAAALILAYYLSVTIKQPLSALEVFFVAVIMVVIATYILFMTGSVVFCRLLKKNKRYYYKPNHFVSVSSMVYRMKRNGASLASICILLTMTLVIISSTASLYFGMENALNGRYPYNVNAQIMVDDISEISEENISLYKNKVKEAIEYADETEDYRLACISGKLENAGLITDVSKIETGFTFEDVITLYIVSLDDYNKIMDTNESLDDDQCLLYCDRIEYNEKEFSALEGHPYKVKKHIDEFFDDNHINVISIPIICMVVKDFEKCAEPLSKLADYNGDQMLKMYWKLGLDTLGGLEAETKICNEIDGIFASMEENGKIFSYMINKRYEERKDFLGIYGGLFFLGILLSIIFLIAAVVIIYYKQISEGYEDRSRFDIMKKVGMTKGEIKKSINSQILTVFFLPLIFAGFHLAFALPMIWKLLMLLNLNDLTFTIIVTIISFIIFGLFYVIVYKITSNSYYSIVSGRRE